MDKMREEFELAYVMYVCDCDAERAAKRIMEMDGEGLLARHSEVYDHKYCQQSTNDAWWAWKASRAALCVELPGNLNGEYYADGWNACLERVEGKLEDAGVSYK